MKNDYKENQKMAGNDFMKRRKEEVLELFSSWNKLLDDLKNIYSDTHDDLSSDDFDMKLFSETMLKTYTHFEDIFSENSDTEPIFLLDESTIVADIHTYASIEWFVQDLDYPSIELWATQIAVKFLYEKIVVDNFQNWIIKEKEPFDLIGKIFYGSEDGELIECTYNCKTGDLTEIFNLLTKEYNK